MSVALIEVGVEVETGKVSLIVDGDAFVMSPPAANQLAIDLITANDAIVQYLKSLEEPEDEDGAVDAGRDTPPQVS